MLKKTLAFALSAALFAFSLAGCGGNSIDSAKASDADSQEKTEQAADAPEGASAAPITADKVADGTYPITVDSSSNMFRIVDAQLIVENGSMHCVMTLSGTGYGKLFMGTGDEAAAASEADFIPYVENAEGKYTYDVPVEALDEDTACAAWSIRKGAVVRPHARVRIRRRRSARRRTEVTPCGRFFPRGKAGSAAASRCARSPAFSSPCSRFPSRGAVRARTRPVARQALRNTL